MNAPIQSPIHQRPSASSMSSMSSVTSTTRQSPSTRTAAPAPPPKTASTDTFLRDFTLVAEAAKRAQMAVMMREFESCGLS